MSFLFDADDVINYGTILAYTPDTSGRADDSEKRGDTAEGADDSVGPCGKVCGACISVIIGIILFPLALALLAYNENKFACEYKNVVYAEMNAKQGDCSKAAPGGQFVFFSCDLDASTLLTPSLADFPSNPQSWGAGVPLLPATVAAKQVVEMLVCKEECESSSSKNAVGQNVKTKKCTYKRSWESSPFNKEFNPVFFQTGDDFQKLAKEKCPGLQLKAYQTPKDVQVGEQTIYAKSPAAGAYLISPQLAKQLEPKARVYLKDDTKVGDDLKVDGGAILMKNNADGENCTKDKDARLGCVRFKYYANSARTVSVFARSVDGKGATGAQEVPGSWGCPKAPWQAIVGERLTKNGAIEILSGTNQTKVWVVRLIGALLAWFAIFLCLQPVAAAAELLGDCINWCPCGGYLQDFIDGVVGLVLCAISCSVGCSCALFVIAIVWLFMNPLIGGLLLFVAFALIAAAVFARKMFAKPKAEKDPDAEAAQEQVPVAAAMPMAAPAAETMAASTAYAMPAAVPVAVAAPVATPVAMPVAAPVAVPVATPVPQMMQVQCPYGAGPGYPVTVMAPDGRQLQVVVPQGVGPGMYFQVQV